VSVVHHVFISYVFFIWMEREKDIAYNMALVGIIYPLIWYQLYQMKSTKNNNISITQVF
jgi:hypothetical protein